MARYNQSPAWFDPETERQREMASSLRNQSMTPQQGQMVSGHYVSPGIGAAIAPILQAYASKKIDSRANEQESSRQKQIAQALRTPEEIPAGIRAPNYQPPQLTDRLAGLQDNPQAQQMAMQLRMNEAMKQEQPRLQTTSGTAYGFPEGTTVQVNPQTGQVTPLYEPKAPDFNQPIIMGPDGRPMPNQAYIDAQSQIRAAGKSGGVNIDFAGMMGGAPELGKLATDYGYVLDPQTRQPVINPDTGLPVAAPVPGSKEAQAIEALNQKQTGSDEKERSTANLVVEDIQRAKNIIQDNPQLTTGLLGPTISKWGGTPAADLNSLLDTVGANISFDYLNTMRQNSPTGGALGNVTERELDLLRATAGNLKQSQSPEQLTYNLERLQRQFNEVINGPQAAQQQVTQPDNGGIDPELLQYMSPEERALFE